MQAETAANVDIIATAIDLLRKHVKYDVAKARLAALETEITAADFWNDQAAAQDTMREKNRLERQLDVIDSLQNEMYDAVGLIELGTAEGDSEIVAEAEATLAKLVTIAENASLRACCQARLMVMTVSLRFMQVPVAPRPKIGR